MKQVGDAEPKEIVDAPADAEVEPVAAPTNGAAEVVEPAVEVPEPPAKAEEVTESVPATNGSSESVEATNGEAKVEAESAEKVAEAEPVVVSAEKRKSDVVAVDDDKPDSTEVAVKKAKVDAGDEVAEEVAPVVEASA